MGLTKRSICFLFWCFDVSLEDDRRWNPSKNSPAKSHPQASSLPKNVFFLFDPIIENKKTPPKRKALLPTSYRQSSFHPVFCQPRHLWFRLWRSWVSPANCASWRGLCIAEKPSWKCELVGKTQRVLELRKTDDPGGWPYRDTPKWMVVYHGKLDFLMDDLGENTTIFGTSIYMTGWWFAHIFLFSRSAKLGKMNPFWRAYIYNIYNIYI